MEPMYLCRGFCNRDDPILSLEQRSVVRATPKHNPQNVRKVEPIFIICVNFKFAILVVDLGRPVGNPKRSHNADGLGT